MRIMYYFTFFFEGDIDIIILTFKTQIDGERPLKNLDFLPTPLKCFEFLNCPSWNNFCNATGKNDDARIIRGLST